MIRTFVAMSTEDHGFRADSVLTTGVELPINRYRARQLPTFYRQAEAALMALPGVRSVGFASSLPLEGRGFGQPFEVAGDPPVEASSRQTAHYQMVNVGYFAICPPARRSASSTKRSYGEICADGSRSALS